MAKQKTTTATVRVWRFAAVLTANGERLTIAAREGKDKTITSAVMHRVGTKTRKAMVEKHATRPDAEARVNRLASEALKDGWLPKPGRKAKVPAFTEIPKPGTYTPPPVVVKPKQRKQLKAKAARIVAA